jgi:hypothetical protein
MISPFSGLLGQWDYGRSTHAQNSNSRLFVEVKVHKEIALEYTSLIGWSEIEICKNQLELWS